MISGGRLYTRNKITLFLSILTSITFCCSAEASNCRLALVLALDVSASVDEREYTLQLEGVARSLEAPEIRNLLLQDRSAFVELSVFEWSAVAHKVIVLPWTKLDSVFALENAAMRIRNHSQSRAGSRTGIGAALEFASAMLSERPECLQHKVDVSGDGKNNVGDSPSYVRRLPELANVTINALVITDAGDDPSASTGHYDKQFDLHGYFKEQVIWGPGAFSVSVVGFENYADAMLRKLVREMQFPTMSWHSGSADKSRHHANRSLANSVSR